MSFSENLNIIKVELLPASTEKLIMLKAVHMCITVCGTALVDIVKFVVGCYHFVCCQVFDFILEAEEMKSITALNKGWRYIVPMIQVSGLYTLSLMVRIYNVTF